MSNPIEDVFDAIDAVKKQFAPKTPGRPPEVFLRWKIEDGTTTILECSTTPFTGKRAEGVHEGRFT